MAPSFDAYNAARSRDTNGYDVNGYTVHEHNPAWKSLWTVSKNGRYVATFHSRTAAHLFVDLVT